MFVYGNWKMHADMQMLSAFADELLAYLAGLPDSVCLGVAPAYPYLAALRQALPQRIAIGAQNVHWDAEGAYTGDVSAGMLCEMGCSFAIVGHSERREHFGETNASAARRCKAALDAGMEAVFCVGEKADVRELEAAYAVVQEQLQALLEQVQGGALRIAYEPVWAIGSGEVASLEHINAMHCFIIEYLEQRLATKVPVLYGGSLKVDNAQSIFALDSVAGGLVGGASLSATDLVTLGRLASDA